MLISRCAYFIFIFFGFKLTKNENKHVLFQIRLNLDPQISKKRIKFCLKSKKNKNYGFECLKGWNLKEKIKIADKNIRLEKKLVKEKGINSESIFSLYLDNIKKNIQLAENTASKD